MKPQTTSQSMRPYVGLQLPYCREFLSVGWIVLAVNSAAMSDTNVYAGKCVVGTNAGLSGVITSHMQSNLYSRLVDETGRCIGVVVAGQRTGIRISKKATLTIDMSTGHDAQFYTQTLSKDGVSSTTVERVTVERVYHKGQMVAMMSAGGVSYWIESITNSDELVMAALSSTCVEDWCFRGAGLMMSLEMVQGIVRNVAGKEGNMWKSFNIDLIVELTGDMTRDIGKMLCYEVSLLDVMRDIASRSGLKMHIEDGTIVMEKRIGSLDKANCLKMRLGRVE